MNLQPISLPPVRNVVAMICNSLEKDALDRIVSRLRTMEAVVIDMPPKFSALITPARYKVYYGGRGGAKSWSIARALVKLAAERLYMLEVDPEAYEHVWGGHCRTISNAVIFCGRFEIGDFDEPPPGTRLYYGADWGFSQDPTALVRCWIDGEDLKVDQEAYEVGVELDNLPQPFAAVPGAEEWPILADSSRPETISHVRRKGFQVSAAPKSPRKIPGSGRTSTDVSLDGVFLTASPMG